MFKSTLLTVFLYLVIALVVLQYSAVDLVGWAKGGKAPHCHIPNYPPFYLDVWDFIAGPQPINCGEPQLPLTYVDQGSIYLNQTAIAKLKSEDPLISEVECSYSNIKRSGSSVHFEFVKTVQSGESLKEEFIWVKCVTIPGADTIYEMGHAMVQPKPSIENKKTGDAVSVFMLVIGSTSRLNFIRQMPKSHKVLTEELNAIYLKGLNTVGDSAFSNLMVMLSGQAQRHLNLQSNEDLSLGDDSAVDDVPLIWNNFSENGYVTLYNGDEPIFNNNDDIFFGKQPTDFYSEPLWLVLRFLERQKFSSSDLRCYGHIPKHHILLNYTRNVLLKLLDDERPYFALTRLNSLSHSNINEINAIDEGFAVYMQDLLRKGVFENAVVAVLGDRGNGYDDFSATPLGKLEERMPLLAISLPKSLQHLKGNLEANSEILSSWYDFHKMLLDIATGNTKSSSQEVRHGKRGISFFQHIPASRTCFEIGIPAELCICQNEKRISALEPLVQRAAEVLLQHVNSIITVRDKQRECTAPLQYNHTLTAHLVHMSVDSDDLRLRLAISVLPSGAHLEAVLRMATNTTAASVVGAVTRINHSGNLSACVNDEMLKHVCHCTRNLQDK